MFPSVYGVDTGVIDQSYLRIICKTLNEQEQQRHVVMGWCSQIINRYPDGNMTDYNHQGSYCMPCGNQHNVA